MPLYLAEIVAYDPTLGTTRTLRYASGSGYTTSGSATPANTFYDGRLAQPADLTRSIFAPGATQGTNTVGIGELELLNPDGGLDDLLAYGFDGRAVTIRVSDAVAPAYPTDFTTLLVATITVPEFMGDRVRFKLRDRLAELQLPIQSSRFAGTNTLPNGLEGVANDLKGKPKPLVYGVVKNIPAPCVNTSKLIYQVNDGTISSVDAVYDRGVALLSGVGTWTSRTSGFSSTVIRDVCYGASLFVAVGQQGKISTSPDGATWTARTSGLSGTTIIYGVAYGNSLYVAVAEAGQIITSPDGVTWTSRTSGVATDIVGVTYGNGLYVAVGASGVILTSPDGVTWTSRSSGIVGDTLSSVAYANGLYVAVDANASKTSTSPDGTTWTANTLIGTNTYGYIAPGLTGFIAVDASLVVATTIDGKTFSEQRTFVPSPGKAVRGVAAGNGQLVYVGDSGAIGVSLDGGVTWALKPSGVTVNLQRCAFGGNTFVAVGNSGTVLTSSTVSTYASQTDLLDDTLAPAAGTYKYLSDASGSFFRLGAPPAGLITADVTQGANAAARTAGQLWGTILTRAGKIAGTDYSSSDITTLDTANSAVCGIYVGIDAPDTTAFEVLDQFAQSVGAWWAPDRTGLLRIRQFTAPSGSATATITENDLLRPLERIPTNDPASGLPVYRCTVRWGKVYAVQNSDLAAGVTDAQRGIVSKEWREAIATDTAIQTSFLLAPETVEDSLLSTETDAQTEATRRLALRKVRRDQYELVLQLSSATRTLDLGDVIDLVHPRFGLSVVDGGGVQSATTLFRIIGVTPNAAANEVTLRVWGKATGVRNRITTDGIYRATIAGAYRITTAA